MDHPKRSRSLIALNLLYMAFVLAPMIFGVVIVRSVLVPGIDPTVQLLVSSTTLVMMILATPRIYERLESLYVAMMAGHGETPAPQRQPETSHVRTIPCGERFRDFGFAPHVSLRSPSAQAVPVAISRELTKVYREPGGATLVVQNAGFPRTRIPQFTNAEAFWSRILEEIANGVLRAGIRPIIDEALRQYPGNQVFQLYRRDALVEPT